MKNAVLMFVTAVLLCANNSFADGNGDVGSVGESRENAKFLSKVEMDQYYIRAENVESVDILVDYQMVRVDCHGLNVSYQATETTDRNHSILIQKEYLPTTANVCPQLPGTEKQAQSGLKINVKPRQNSYSIYQTILVPAGSKVEFIRRN